MHLLSAARGIGMALKRHNPWLSDNLDTHHQKYTATKGRVVERIAGASNAARTNPQLLSLKEKLVPLAAKVRQTTRPLHEGI